MPSMYACNTRRMNSILQTHTHTRRESLSSRRKIANTIATQRKKHKKLASLPLKKIIKNEDKRNKSPTTAHNGCCCCYGRIHRFIHPPKGSTTNYIVFLSFERSFVRSFDNYHNLTFLIHLALARCQSVITHGQLRHAKRHQDGTKEVGVRILGQFEPRKSGTATGLMHLFEFVNLKQIKNETKRE